MRYEGVGVQVVVTAGLYVLGQEKVGEILVWHARLAHTQITGVRKRR